MSLFNPMNRTRRRPGGRRRGTVLVLALGVLAILSIAALSYVTVVRLERSNVSVAVRGGNYTKQTDFVVDRMRDILAADLFGNKIVQPGEAGLWREGPSMFEDGEARDVPTLEESTFNTNPDAAAGVSANAVLGSANTLALARPDDAFLASTEPEWDRVNPLATSTWKQITNLRSAYELKGDGAARRWERGDGRFVDLAAWFMGSTTDYADPSIDLLDWSRVLATNQVGPADGRNQMVFDRQANDHSGGVQTLGAVRPSDERQWVDTDGDLRVDSRWTVLDGMNTLGGLKWVVAARIIDASALVNVNASIEFGGVGAYPSDEVNLPDAAGFRYLGDGRTPADVDLPRMLDRLNRSAMAPYTLEVTTNRLFTGNRSFERHLIDGLGMGLVVEDSELSPPIPPFMNWSMATPSEPAQRHDFWRLFGQNAMEPSALGKRGGGYSVRDLVDLAAYSGTNNQAVVSRIEHALDGTETMGYLPNDPDPSTGPMRSKEGIAGSGAPTIRRLIQDTENFNTMALPTGEQLIFSARRLLTPVSGVGMQSPVPVLNDALDTEFEGKYALERIRVGAKPENAIMEPPYRETKRKLVSESFQSLVWALAPLVTDKPLNWAASAAGAGSGFDVAGADSHYGGYSGDAVAPYRSLTRTLYPPNSGNPPVTEPEASFAVLTAAQMAANIVDAIDNDQPSGGTPTSRPTIVTLYNDVNPPSPGLYESVALGTRLAQGDIASASIPWVDAANPYLIVGLERQPFLRDVSLIAVYSDASSDSVGNDDGLTGPSVPVEALGSVVRVVLQNPWPTTITVGPEIQVVIPETPDLIDDLMTPSPMEPFRMALPLAQIPAGETVTFLWTSLPSSSPQWSAIVTEIQAKTEFNRGGPLFFSVPSVTPSAPLVPFEHLLADAGSGVDRGVLLTYKDPANTLTPEVVIDRMRSGATFPEKRLGPTGPFDFRDSDPPFQPDNFPVGFAPSNIYVVNNGMDPATLPLDTRWSNGIAPHFTGRALYSTSLSRPTLNRAGGMSAVVIEAPAKNVVRTRLDAVAWFYEPGTQGNLDAVRSTAHSIVTEVAATDIDFPNDHVKSDLVTDPTWADEGISYGPSMAELPVFQLFVPNNPLIAASDLLRICTFAHTCRFSASTADVNDLRNWRTVSEKLGLTLQNDNAAVGPLNDLPNAYLGVLDPTRYVLGGDLSAPANLPDSMRIPLALRVPDCFEACQVTTDLVQGRINLNTAPLEVLGALPLTQLDDALAPPSFAPADGGLINSNGRRDLMNEYRTPMQALSIAGPLPLGMRTRSTDLDAGFVTPAEVAVLGNWKVFNTELTGEVDDAVPGAGTFLEAGSGGLANDYSPLQSTEYAAESLQASPVPVKPIDDPEERLALYRAISNIATARSDVFIAWFVIRGYDAQAVEQIPLGATGPISENQAIAVMDSADSNFRPVHESRWLVVFDRSQTESGAPLTKPTERPRVLMKVQLPSAKP